MTNVEMATVARLVGEPARAAMLTALLGGRALTALELACDAGVTPQTASSHLSKLTGAGLLAVNKRGRFRYYRLASPLVGEALEAVMVLGAESTESAKGTKSVKNTGNTASTASAHTVPSIDPVLRRARTCYDHLAGKLGVALADALAKAHYIILDHDAGEVTQAGMAFLTDLGVDLERPFSKSRRVFCRPCLDWSERRPHLAGFVGAALANYCFDQGLLKRQRHGRALTITERGSVEFRKSFGIHVGDRE